MKTARDLSFRAVDTAALDFARQLQAGLNGIRLESEGSGGSDDGGGGSGGGEGGGSGDDGGGSGGGTGDGGGQGGAGGGQGGSGGGSDAKGYPENTPLAEMTVEQREAYWKHKARKHEERANARADYDEVKAKAEQWEQHQKSKQSDEERLREEAREEGRKLARHEAALDLVDARLEAAAAARGVSSEQLQGALEFLDRGRFLDDDDKVDTDKVTAFVATISPGTGTGGNGRHPDLGQGRRPGHGGTSAKEKGQEEARRRFATDKK